MEGGALIGLGIIIIGWIFQLIYSWNGNKELSKNFLILYSVGVALLIIDCYLNNLRWTGIFNTICLMLSLILLIKVSEKNKINNFKIITKTKKKRR